MKEQAGLGAISPENYQLLCMDCANNLIMSALLLIQRAEYERLKRLDENVKKNIKMYQDHVDALKNNYMGSTQECLICKDMVKLLESLDK